MTPVIVNFSLGKGESSRNFRLVVRPNERLDIEGVSRDRLGADSWHVITLQEGTIERVLAAALMKSQMTPTQRLEHPTMLHPEGIIYMSGECSISLGRLS